MITKLKTKIAQLENAKKEFGEAAKRHGNTPTGDVKMAYHWAAHCELEFLKELLEIEEKRETVLYLDTETIPGMAGEPMEIIRYLKGHFTEITREEWEAEATEENLMGLQGLIQETGEQNHQIAINWVK